MHVLIFGATGGIGQYVVRHVLQNGHHVTAYVCRPEKMQMSGAGLTEEEKIAEAVSGKNTVIWCVGIPMKRGYPGMASLEGHKILIREMREQGVKRLIDWGTPSISPERDQKSFLTVAPCILAGIAFPQAKREMVAIGELVRTSGLDWTLVRFIGQMPILGS